MHCQGKGMTEILLLFAILPLENTSVTTKTYWAYDSLALHFVNWEENDIPAYVNDFDIFDAPTANHIVS